VNDNHENCTCHARAPARLPLRFFPDSVLDQGCSEVSEITEEVCQLAKDMLLTMMLEGGVGLAAPQVGKLLRLFVVDVDWVRGTKHSNPLVFINPVLEGTGKQTSEEGCLSFPGALARTERFQTIRVSFLDLDGSKQSLEAEGRLAIAIQHEADHLEGKTIRPFLSSYTMGKVTKNIKSALRERKRESRKP